MSDRQRLRASLLAAVLVALSITAPGCRTPSGVDDRAPAFGFPAGTWSGTLTGRDMVTSSGILESPAWLMLDAEGRWTLQMRGAIVAGVARPNGRGLTLEGTVTRGELLAVGRTVWFVLQPQGPGIFYGSGQVVNLGLRIDVVIMLRRHVAGGA